MDAREPADTSDDVESWARRYILSTDLELKLHPPEPPWQFRARPQPERLARPGRPAELRPAKRAERKPKPDALNDPRYRARALHAFFHHELQAAELMCWAILAFPDAELAFRRDLLRVCRDEIRHMNLYRAQIEALAFRIGDFAVRDWFWKRVPSCVDKVSFVALMGMGLEGANLEHAPAFAARFRTAGDEAGALVQERIAKEELAHVRIATRWFQRWTGGCDFDQWRERLPPPLSPLLLRGKPIARELRRRAGMPDAFISALAAYVPAARGRPA